MTTHPRHAPAGPPTAFLRAAAVALALVAPFGHAALASADDDDDRWLGPDKALQFGLGLATGAGGYALGRHTLEGRVESALFGFTVSVALTGAKELLDLGFDTGTASTRDFAWGVVGAGLGVVIAWLIDLAIHRDVPRVPESVLTVGPTSDREIVPLSPSGRP